MSIKLFFPLNFNCNENNDKRVQASERQQSIDYSLIPSFNFVCNCRISVFCFSVLSNIYIRRIPKVYIYKPEYSSSTHICVQVRKPNKSNHGGNDSVTNM